jgi:hypothetical protein
MIEDAEVHCFSYEALQDNEIQARKRSMGEAVESCGWLGKLNDAERHYNECQFVKVKCPHIGCDDNYLRDRLPEHVETCLHRLTPCQWCNIRQKIDQLDAHSLICGKRPVPCPNSCLDVDGAVLYLDPSEIVNHRNLCSLEVIGCKFGGAGCKIKLMRKDMPLHENDTVSHIGCLLEALQTAQAEIIELKKFRGEIEEKVSELDGGVQYAEGRISELESASVSQGEDIQTTLSTTQLIFKVPTFKLKEQNISTVINISEHQFYLALYPNPEDDKFLSLYLFLQADKLISPVDVKADIGLVSHSFFHESESLNFDKMFTAADGTGYDNFIEISELKNTTMKYVQDGFITIRAKITVNP